MEIIHKKDGEKFDLKINYDKLFGKWCEPLSEYLNGTYQSNLMFSLYHMYSSLNLNTRFVDKKDIFKAYKLCEPSKTRVVILNLTPTFNKRSNGLAFGNKAALNDDFDEESITLFNTIEQIQDDNFKIDKDYTLESWAKKGVLLLNYPLINVSETERLKFYNLISKTIEYLNDQSGIIFCFINNNNNYFRAKISDKTNIIINSDRLDYNLLESINRNLEEMNGRDYRIKW